MALLDGRLVKTLGTAAIVGLFALAPMPAFADGSDAKALSNPPAARPDGASQGKTTTKALPTRDGGAAGAGKGNGERPTPGSLPTTKEKQRAIEAATRAGSTQGGTALGDRGPPKPEKTWDEMTPQEQDAARKRWLLNSGDFGPRRGIPKEMPNPTWKPKGP